MKRLSKSLLVLVVAPLLVSCSGKMKAPEFADYGSKVDWSNFTASLEEAYLGSAHVQDDFLKSLEIKKDYQSTLNTESKRNDKTVEISNSSTSNLELHKFDAKDSLYEIDVNYSNNTKSKSSYGKGSNSESEQRVVMYQQNVVDGKSYVLSVDKTRKEYSKLAEIGDDMTAEKILDIAAKDSVSSVVNRFIPRVPTQVEAEAEDTKYSLYVNNRVFTITYIDEDTVENKNTDDVTLNTIVTKTEKIYQVNLTDYSWSYRSSEKTKTTRVYNLTYDTHIQGDTSIREEIAYETSYAVDKEFKLKPTDLSKYTRVSF